MICSREYIVLLIYVGLMDIPFSTIILREAKSGMDFYFHSTFWGSVQSDVFLKKFLFAIGEYLSY